MHIITLYELDSLQQAMTCAAFTHFTSPTWTICPACKAVDTKMQNPRVIFLDSLRRCACCIVSGLATQCLLGISTPHALDGGRWQAHLQTRHAPESSQALEGVLDDL